MSAADAADVDRELLADYLGGALSGTAEKEVERLVATSPQWHAAAEEMTAAFDLVSRDLAVLRGTPEEMPADLVARFDDLLAQPKRDPLAARPVKRGAGKKRRRRWQRWAAPIAVAAAALTFFGLRQLPEAVVGQMSGSAEDSRSNGGHAPLEQPAAALAGVPTAHTGTQYTRESVRSRMTASTATEKGAPLSFGTTAEQQDTARREGTWQDFDQAPVLAACLHAISLTLPGRPTLVEFAYFEGKPALVISITGADNALWRFIAGTGCGQAGPDEIFRAPLQ